MAKKAPNPIDVHVGGRVRARRMMIDMSQEKLGDALRLTFQQVQKYEKGTNRIGASRLAHIAAVLGTSVAFFFEGAPAPDGTRPAGTPLAAELLNAFFTLPGAHELAQHYIALDSDMGARAAIVHVARTLAERRPGAARKAA